MAKLTISDIQALDLGAYATKAEAFRRCVTQLRAVAGDLGAHVVQPLAQPETWECDLTADGQRVAHIHASTAHHAIDALELAYLTLDHLAADLKAARDSLNSLVNDLVLDNCTVADDGTVTVPVDPSTITNRVQRIQAEYEGTYDNYATSPYSSYPGEAQALVKAAIAQFEQIDTNAATVLDTVTEAANRIIVDKTNVALRSNVDASPKGIDALLALYGDPLKDLDKNVEADPGELESAKKMLERFNLGKELSTAEMADLGKVLQRSTDQSLTRLGDLLVDHPSAEQLRDFLENEGTKGFLGVSLLLNYLSYRQSAPTGAAVVESVVTTGVSALAGSVASGTAGAGTAALIDALGGGPEDPIADGAALVAGFLAAGATAEAQTKVWDGINKSLFSNGEDGAKTAAPDPLTLGPNPVRAAAGD